MQRYHNKYKSDTLRLKNFDYRSNGMYYVTICTNKRVYYFGEIKENPVLESTQIGNIAFDYWTQIPSHYPYVELEEFVIMPNHIHGILFFNDINKIDWKPNEVGKQSGNLGAVIRGFKSTLKRYSNLNKINFEWQKGYYDRIIRNDNELRNIQQYILDNPQNWINDKMNLINRKS